MKLKKDYIGRANNDMMTHLILECCTKAHEETFSMYKEEVDFTCQLNGVELDPANFFKHMNEEFYTMVKNEAAQMLKDKLNSLLDSLDNVQRIVQDEFKKKIEDELNLPSSEDS